MSEAKFVCHCCGTSIQGNSELCVLCFSRLAYDCPKCTVRSGKDSKRVRKQGEGGPDVDCDYCNNERYLLKDYRGKPSK